MIELYPEIRQVHVVAVLASGSLFLLRGLAVFAGGSRVLSSLLRYLGYTADTPAHLLARRSWCSASSTRWRACIIRSASCCVSPVRSG